MTIEEELPGAGCKVSTTLSMYKTFNKPGNLESKTFDNGQKVS